MMTRLMLATGLIAAATSAVSASPSSEQAAIVAQSRRLDRAFEHKDFGVWRHVLAPGFTATSAGKKPLTKQQYIDEAMQEAAAALQPIAVRIDPISIRVTGARANAAWRELTCYGVRDKRKRRHHFCYRQSFRDGWAKVGNEWKETRIDYSPGSEFLLDGKRISKRQVQEMLAQ